MRKILFVVILIGLLCLSGDTIKGTAVRIQYNDQASSNYFDIGTMRIQWGAESITTDSAYTVTLPASFANTSYIVTISIGTGWTTGGAIAAAMAVTNKTTTQFDLDRDDQVTGTIPIDWIAIGLRP